MYLHIYLYMKNAFVGVTNENINIILFVIYEQ